MVAVEAMAAGTAPVASAHGAFPELITPGHDGALFPPSDTNALIDILADIEDHPCHWDTLGAQARRTYDGRFDTETGVARLLEIYRFAAAHPVTPTASASQPAGPRQLPSPDVLS